MIIDPSERSTPKRASAKGGPAVMPRIVRVADLAGAGDLPTAERPGPLLIEGRASEALAELPESSVDCVLTSPPYWSVRQYHGSSELGEEPTPERYVEDLVAELSGLERVLKPTGSLWLNIGDTYLRKNLSGIPWRVALALQNEGWILRNAVVWDKVKGNPDNAKDKLRDLYEFVFHFVRQRSYFYDLDLVRNPPAQPTWKNGKVVTATGVSGTRYRRQIDRSTALSDAEREAAHAALDDALERVADASMPDFRMIIRGQQRMTHSDVTEVSGRAKEIEKRGFCILPYHAKGSKPGDVWQIIPEDKWRVDRHCAVFPEELCRVPILTTCPSDGVLLDPFVGTGTAIKVAADYGRCAIGVDTSREYLEVAQVRIEDGASPGDQDETSSAERLELEALVQALA
jgi:DNA modification methylase